MINSLAFGRHVALRIALLQLAVALLAGIAFLLQGPREAVAAALGALFVALGTWLLAVRAFNSLHDGPRMLSRLLTGVLLRWLVVVGGLSVILFQYKLPPLAAVTGLAAAHAVYLLAFRYKG